MLKHHAVSHTVSLFLILMGVGTSYLGCTQQSEIGPPEQELSAYGAFPGTPTSANHDAPLSVRMTQPREQEIRSNVVTLSFSKPMVEAALGEQRVEQPIFAIEPKIEGEFSWVGTRMAVFHPNAPFKPATRYKVSVDSGVKSLDGTQLKKQARFKFHTPFLKVWATSDSDKLKPESTITLKFNLPVEPAELKKALQLTEDGKPVETEITQSTEEGDKKDSEFSLVATAGFELGTRYNLKIDGALRAKNATETLAFGIKNHKIALSKSQRKHFRQRHTAEGYDAIFDTYGEFRILRVECGYREQCYQRSRWTVYFSNPIEANSAKKCLRFASAKANKSLDNYVYGTEVSVSTGGLKQGKSHTLIASTGCTDIFGNHLKKERRFRKTLEYNRPNIQMGAGFRLFESSKPSQLPAIPVGLENLEQSAYARIFNVPNTELPRLRSSYREIDATSPPKNLSGAKTRTLGENAKRGQPNLYHLNLSNTLKTTPGSVYLDLYAPETVTKYHDGTRRSLLVFSDLGITVKTDARNAYIWVTRLSTGAPVEKSEVGLWDNDGNAQWSGKTDENGLVTAPLPDAAPNARRPDPIITASWGDDMSILDVGEWQSSVRMYRFGVPYASSSRSPLQAKNFIFTERGVYKSGDTVHIKGFTRLQKDGALEAMPAESITLSVQDSRGKNVALQTAQLSPQGGFSLDVKLPCNSPLGTYQIKATPTFSDATEERTPLLKELGSGKMGTFRVEAYRTPEFEVLVEPGQKDVVVGSSVPVAVHGRYLFGAPMRGSKTTWTARRSRSYFESPDFPKFSFRSDTGNHWYYDASYSRNLSNGSDKLSDDGRVELDLKIPKNKDFSGPQTVLLEASVTDINRQEISGRAQVKVHPGQYYVGVLQPSYLVAADETIHPKAIATDHDGHPIAGKKITLRVVRREWKNEQKKNANGSYSWTTTTEDTPVDSCTLTSKLTPVSCAFNLPGGGSYRVLAESKDAAGNKLASVDSFYAYGGGGYSWGRDDSERIDLVANADRYKVGDVATVMVKSPFKRAHALVTVEQDGVLSQFTTELVGSSPTVEIPITDKMQPNAFVSVSLIRGRIDAKIDTDQQTSKSKRDPGRPTFKIGYAELKVDHSDKVLAVDVQSDRESYRPGDRAHATIQLRDHQGEPVSGEVTFMAVDQGVLSLTGYKTPAPTEYFYASHPLGVSNNDTRLMLSTRADLKAEEKRMKSAAGGSGSGSGTATNYRTDFAAAAAFKAQVTVGEDGEASVDFELPDNLTAYRLMAVAVGAKNRFGSADKRITVNKPLMVRPSLPRFGSTGDIFDARAVIQAMDDFKGKVEVSVAIDGALSLTGETTKTIALKAGANQEVAFPVRAGLPGDATIKFIAQSVDHPATTDSVEITIPVKFPAAKDTYIQTGTLALNESFAKPKMQRRIELPDSIRKDVGGLEITLSSSRIAELLPGMDYLNEYPYGCAEQVTSRVLGVISMRDVARGLGLPGLSSDELESRARAGINRVLAQQTRDGGISYWAGTASANDWASVYSALAIVRAREDDAYKVDSKQYLDLLEYLRKILRKNTPSLKNGMRSALATKAFAAWVLAEAGVAEPAYHVELYNRRRYLPRFAQLLLAMAMHSANANSEYRNKLLDEVLEDAEVDLGGDGGAAILRDLKDEDPEGWRIWQSPIRENALALIALLRMRPNDPLIPKFAQGLLRKRQHGYWGNTQNTAFALMALGEYFGRAQQKMPDYQVLVGTGQKVVAKEEFKKLEIRPRRVFIPMKELAKYEGKLLTIAQKGSGGPLYYSAKLTSAPKDPPTHAFDGGFHLKREYVAVDGPNAGQAIDSVHAGQVVKIRLTLTVPEDRHYVAIEDPLPAGFEAINTSFATASKTRAADQLTPMGGNYGWWWSYWRMQFDYSEQHDDRVTLFADELRAGIYRHAYLARATTPGKFTAPAAQVEAMYDPTVYGRSNARDLDIN